MARIFSPLQIKMEMKHFKLTANKTLRRSHLALPSKPFLSLHFTNLETGPFIFHYRQVLKILKTSLCQLKFNPILIDIEEKLLRALAKG